MPLEGGVVDVDIFLSIFGQNMITSYYVSFVHDTVALHYFLMLDACSAVAG